MTFTFLGAYDPDYPRNAVIRKGLRQIGAFPRECRASRRLKFWARYPILFLRLLGAPKGGKCLFVPEFCQKDVPLARLWATLTARKVVFDPLAARYETKVTDWRRLAPDSPSAWWNRQTDRAAFAGADLVLADTAAHKAYYCETYGLDPAKVAVLPLGYDDDIFRPAPARPFPPGIAAGRPFDVLFTGSFLPLHGTDVIIEAARIVAARDPGVRFTLAGTGRTLEAARRAAAGLANVAFAGWRPLAALPASIAAADVCLGIFGRTEKARRVVPHKLVQAMGVGRAVITARTPAAEEFFAHRENVVFCDEPLAESLAAAVLELKADAALRERIARAGCALVRERFSPSATARRLMDIVEKRFGKSCHPEHDAARRGGARRRSAEKGDTEPCSRFQKEGTQNRDSCPLKEGFCSVSPLSEIPRKARDDTKGAIASQKEGTQSPAHLLSMAGLCSVSPLSARNDISQSISLPPYKGMIARAYALPEFLAALASPAALASGAGAEVLLAGRNTVTAVAIGLPGRSPAEIVLKSFGARGFKRLKTLVEPSKAARAWRGAAALAAAGFGTAAPVAYLERRRGGLVRESWFAAEKLDGGREVRALFRELPGARLEPLLAALASELARLHSAGLVHRDLSDGNVLVFDAGGDAAPRFAFLDTNRVRRRSRLGRFSRARNLVRLGVPAPERAYFLERYAAAAGRPLEPGFSLCYRLAKSSFSGWIALRKKLRLKALARKLRIQ